MLSIDSRLLAEEITNIFHEQRQPEGSRQTPEYWKHVNMVEDKVECFIQQRDLTFDRNE